MGTCHGHFLKIPLGVSQGSHGPVGARPGPNPLVAPVPARVAAAGGGRVPPRWSSSGEERGARGGEVAPRLLPVRDPDIPLHWWDDDGFRVTP